MNGAMKAQLQAMLAAMGKARGEVQPSAFWQHLGKRNIEDLDLQGYANFKRTVALNYFTWVVNAEDSQLKFLTGHLSRLRVELCRYRAKRAANHDGFRSALKLDAEQALTPDQVFHLNFLTYLLWSYASRHDASQVLKTVDEPLEGNPPLIFIGKKLISQDLANSALEFNSIMCGSVDRGGVRSILELGAGYGRTAYVFLKMLSDVRYIVADIPPALGVAEEYLRNQFPDKKVFPFRDFSNYADVSGEFESSQIAFLLPSQLELLPDKSVDMFINISSLHEMTHDQIAYYFGILERLVAHYFYLKAWKISHLPDKVTITESDYPFSTNWTRLFWRECPVQTEFFEALLQRKNV